MEHSPVGVNIRRTTKGKLNTNGHEGIATQGNQYPLPDRHDSVVNVPGVRCFMANQRIAQHGGVAFGRQQQQQQRRRAAIHHRQVLQQVAQGDANAGRSAHQVSQWSQTIQ